MKEENEKKGNILVRVHLEELEDLKKENSLLKEEIAIQNISKEQEISRGTLKPKTKTLDQLEDQNNPNLEVSTLKFFKNKQSKL